MDLGLAGKVAVVTGASQGMGRAHALTLAREGARVAICSRTLQNVERTAREIEQETRSEILPVQADVMVKSDLEALVAATVARFGRIDIVVNNADSDPKYRAERFGFFELPDEAWLEKFNIKFLAHVRLIRLAAPYMMSNRWGRIINIGGGATRKMREGGWEKGAVQAGLINLTKKLADLLGPYGITCNVVEPGGVWSDGKTISGRSRAEMRREEIQEAADAEGVSYEEMEKRHLSKLVIGRRIEAQDAANVVAFLASERSATITGEVVIADGGQTRAVRF